MIHHWECIRCTNQWTSSCFQFFGDNTPEAKLKRRKKSWSWLCSGCFAKLENGDFGVEIQGIYDLAFKLRDRSNGWEDERLVNILKKSVEELRAEQTAAGKPVEELYRVVNEIESVYKTMMKEFETPARKELDEYHKKQGYTFFGAQPRPEGFVGD